MTSIISKVENSLLACVAKQEHAIFLKFGGQYDGPVGKLASDAMNKVRDAIDGMYRDLERAVEMKQSERAKERVAKAKKPSAAGTPRRQRAGNSFDHPADFGPPKNIVCLDVKNSQTLRRWL